jgi:hypothetical protein
MQPFVISGKAKDAWPKLALKTEYEAKRIIEDAYERHIKQVKDLQEKTTGALEAAQDLTCKHIAGGSCPYDENITECRNCNSQKWKHKTMLF